MLMFVIIFIICIYPHLLHESSFIIYGCIFQNEILQHMCQYRKDKNKFNNGSTISNTCFCKFSNIFESQTHKIFSWIELNFMLLQFYTYLTESGNSSCNCSSLLFTILGLGKKFFSGSKLQVVIHTLTTPSV